MLVKGAEEGYMKTRTLIAAAVAALAFGGFAKDIYLLVGRQAGISRKCVLAGVLKIAYLCIGPHC